MTTRPAESRDRESMIAVLDDTELFPPDMLDELMSPYFGDPDNREHWFVLDDDTLGVIGFGYVRPEELADGVWNLLAIGVRSEAQGKGAGRQLMAYAEKHLSTERLLIVETSGTEQYALTRRFYEKLGYSREAVIRDYWADGDDKVIFSKRLA